MDVSAEKMSLTRTRRADKSLRAMTKDTSTSAARNRAAIAQQTLDSRDRARHGKERTISKSKLRTEKKVLQTALNEMLGWE